MRSLSCPCIARPRSDNSDKSTSVYINEIKAVGRAWQTTTLDYSNKNAHHNHMHGNADTDFSQIDKVLFFVNSGSAWSGTLDVSTLTLGGMPLLGVWTTYVGPTSVTLVTPRPTNSPTTSPSAPSARPTSIPTIRPTTGPTTSPSAPSARPTSIPTAGPTIGGSSARPTRTTSSPTHHPTSAAPTHSSYYAFSANLPVWGTIALQGLSPPPLLESWCDVLAVM